MRRCLLLVLILKNKKQRQETNKGKGMNKEKEMNKEKGNRRRGNLIGLLFEEVEACRKITKDSAKVHKRGKYMQIITFSNKQIYKIGGNFYEKIFLQTKYGCIKRQNWEKNC